MAARNNALAVGYSKYMLFTVPELPYMLHISRSTRSKPALSLSEAQTYRSPHQHIAQQPFQKQNNDTSHPIVLLQPLSDVEWNLLAVPECSCMLHV
jgi:hypothetical protein